MVVFSWRHARPRPSPLALPRWLISAVTGAAMGSLTSRATGSSCTSARRAQAATAGTMYGAQPGQAGRRLSRHRRISDPPSTVRRTNATGDCEGRIAALHRFGPEGETWRARPVGAEPA